MRQVLRIRRRGAGDDGPIITGTARDPEQLSVELQENMVFIFKPSAETGAGVEKRIVTWGDTILIGANGARRLGKRPHQIAVAG